MRFRLPRLPAPSPVVQQQPSFFAPSYRTLSAALDSSAGQSRRFSYSSNSGRSSSRDGSERAKPSSAPESSPSSSSRSASTVAPQRPCAPPAPVVQRQAGPRDRFVLPHANEGLVQVDSFFATHRPLLELPIKLDNRRSTRLSAAQTPTIPSTDDLTSLVAERKMEVVRLGEEGESGEEVRVVDVAEDGTPMGAPYTVRIQAMEPLKSVEEELAAEEKAEADLLQRVEIMHEAEAESSEPYDAWMIGQHQVQPAPIARYLAQHPPFTPPSTLLSSSVAPAPSSPSAIRSHLAFLSPFTPQQPATSTPSAPSSSFPAFVDHFVAPLEPHESGSLADSFLSSAQMKQAFAARTEYVRSAGEALRQAQQIYAGVDKATQAQFPLPHAASVAAAERGMVNIWDEQKGWISLKVAQHDAGLSESPFLPAEMVEVDDVVISLDSVKRKRHKKMLKHKYKKRRKAQRALRQRLGK
ncbi:hypothetical protein JCM6882_001053 [Rhodosporidiobolus microsporus]